MNIESVSVITISPEAAKTLLAETASEMQRALRPHRVTFLAEEMLRGQFKQRTLIAIGWDKERGRYALLDGQHRLSAVVKSGCSQEFLVSYEDYTTTASLKAAYTKIDQGMRRTPFDKFSALGLAEQFGMPADLINRLSATCKFILDDFGTGRHNFHDGDLIEMMSVYAPICTMYSDDVCAIAVDRSAMLRASTMSVALPAYFSSHREKAREFWVSAAGGLNLDTGDPRLFAFRHIVNTAMPGRDAKKPKTATAAYSSRYLARCYNLWMTGERRQIVKLDGSELQPMFIFGTAFDGKSVKKNGT